MVSFVGAVLAALQTFLKFAERASEHKASAASYRALARSIDIFLLKHNGIPMESRDYHAFESGLTQLEKIAYSLSDLAGSSPHVTRSSDSDIDKSERIP